ncbi:MAG: hypothetical protein ACFBSF_02575 [Leptolyngbyaceae cyanobacterium]
MKPRNASLRITVIFFSLTFFLVAGIPNLGSSTGVVGETYYEETEQLYSQNVDNQQESEGAIPSQERFLIFGYSADATPISDEKGQGSDRINEDTFCGKIYERLSEDIENEGSYFKGYRVRTVKLDSSQRFKGLLEHERLSDIAFQREIGLNEGEEITNEVKRSFFEDNLGLECGPNSITDEREDTLKAINGTFSNKFYTTGAKVLIHRDKRHLLYQPGFFADDSNEPSTLIGVVGGERQNDEVPNGCPEEIENDVEIGTTTGYAVQAIYGAQVKVLVLREQAKECLVDDKIAAYSSDEILLRGMLDVYSDDLRDYVIEPHIAPLTHEAYGIVAYGNDDARDSLVQRINQWSGELGEYLKENEEKLPKYSVKQNNSSWIESSWHQIDSFYRSLLPLFLLKSSRTSLILVSCVLTLVSATAIVLILTHRWIATPIAKLFPWLFRWPLGLIEKLRIKGYSDNSKVLQLLADMLRGPEQLIREIYNKSQGINKSEIDSYDVVQVFEAQVKFAKQVRSEEEVEEEEIATNIAEQIKTDPHARRVVNELFRLFTTSLVNKLGTQVGEKSGDKFMNVLTRIAEQVYRAD